MFEKIISKPRTSGGRSNPPPAQKITELAERKWKRVSIYVNFENLLDVRQTNFDTIYTGSIAQPHFRDIYAPLDGFVANAGLKLNL